MKSIINNININKIICKNESNKIDGINAIKVERVAFEDIK